MRKPRSSSVQTYIVCMKAGAPGLPFRERDVVIVNFGEFLPSIRWALAWIKRNDLLLPNLKTVSDLSEYCPDLNRELTDPMAVVCPPSSGNADFASVQSAWWKGSERGLSIYSLSNGLPKDCWVVCVRKRLDERLRDRLRSMFFRIEYVWNGLCSMFF